MLQQHLKITSQYYKSNNIIYLYFIILHTYETRNSTFHLIILTTIYLLLDLFNFEFSTLVNILFHNEIRLNYFIGTKFVKYLKKNIINFYFHIKTIISTRNNCVKELCV